MGKTSKTPGFGLIVIGNEILDGRRHDAHFQAAFDLLSQRRLALQYTLYLPDDTDTIVAHLRWAFARPFPFFSCGGIGGTPDDLTRACAARAAETTLQLHREALAIVTARFGEAQLTSARRRMLEFPRGADLIPNPVNQVPGFAFRNGYFVPGFPRMARPMMAWVLDSLYEPGDARAAVTLTLPGAREGDLGELMDWFTESFPDVSFSSLPRLVDSGFELDLGVAGPPAAVEAAVEALQTRMEADGIAWVRRGN